MINTRGIIRDHLAIGTLRDRRSTIPWPANEAGQLSDDFHLLFAARPRALRPPSAAAPPACDSHLSAGGSRPWPEAHARREWLCAR